MEMLRVENLTKIYGTGENQVRALDGVSFSVEKGQFVSIIGPSGVLGCTSTRRTQESPTGLGRKGERVAKTPMR